MPVLENVTDSQTMIIRKPAAEGPGVARKLDKAMSAIDNAAKQAAAKREKQAETVSSFARDLAAAEAEGPAHTFDVDKIAELLSDPLLEDL